MQSKENMINFGRDALGLSVSVPVELSPLEGRGSGRTFFRLKWDAGNSAILIHYDPKREENAYYADIASFLREIDVPVPRLIRHSPVECLIAVEDLGETDLWSFREASWDTRRSLYEKLLAAVHRLHSFPKNDFPSGRVKLMRGFGPSLYLWERDYFRDHFVKGVCKIKLGPSFERDLEAELSGLAERLARTARCLVHRDLQSHNVMIRGDAPYLIDFQGMRFGSPFYDLGSLLCDPYVTLPENEREELLSLYYSLTTWDLNWVSFRNTFWEASAQRLMQALGAYGFLGFEKGLKPFLESIPTGLRNLELAVSEAGSLRQLHELSVECQRTIEKNSLTISPENR